MQRFRNFSDLPKNRRRQRSEVEGKGSPPNLDLDTAEGGKARQQMAEKDIADLKRKWREVEVSSASRMPVIDLGDGAVLVGFTKGYWVQRAGPLVAVVATLETPGTSDITSGIYVSGAFQENMTIPAGESLVKHDCYVSFNADDIWQMYQVATVADAFGLTYYGVLL